MKYGSDHPILLTYTYLCVARVDQARLSSISASSDTRCASRLRIWARAGVSGHVLGGMWWANSNLPLRRELLDVKIGLPGQLLFPYDILLQDILLVPLLARRTFMCACLQPCPITNAQRTSVHSAQWTWNGKLPSLQLSS